MKRRQGVDVRIANRLRRRRTFLGLSQDALSRSAGVALGKIQEYERGDTNIDPNLVAPLARALRVSAEYLQASSLVTEQKGASSRHSSPAQPEEIADGPGAEAARETAELVCAYRKVANPELRKWLFHMIRHLASLE